MSFLKVIDGVAPYHPCVSRVSLFVYLAHVMSSSRKVRVSILKPYIDDLLSRGNWPSEEAIAAMQWSDVEVVSKQWVLHAYIAVSERGSRRVDGTCMVR